jgi:hypothetical protein
MVRVRRYEDIVYYDGPRVIYTLAGDAHVFLAHNGSEYEGWPMYGAVVPPYLYYKFLAGQIDYYTMIRSCQTYVKCDLNDEKPKLVSANCEEVVNLVKKGFYYRNG